MDFDQTVRYGTNKNIYFDTQGSPGRALVELAKKAARAVERRSKLAYRPVFSEQTLEYPLLYQAIEPGVKTILDFGSVENILPMVLCSLGYQVTGLDFLPYPFQHPNFRFIQHDIMTWGPKEDAFDMVISISTMEHVGLGYSGDPLQQDGGDKIAAGKLWKSLRKGGKLYVTLPAGKPHEQRGYRTYNEARIRQLFPNIERLRFFRKAGRFEPWAEEQDSSRIDSLSYSNYDALYPTEAVAIIEARKL